MSSSEEEKTNTRQSGRNYRIDLQAFSSSRIRLETELRNNHSSIEILDTYCTDGTKFNEVNPLLNPDGAFPLLRELYKHEDGGYKAPWGVCSLTDEGEAFRAQMSGDGAGHVTECSYGDIHEQTPLPSPTAIHHWPAKAWRTINTYYIKMGSTDIYTKANWKSLTKLVKKWLTRVHKIWSKIVGRLPESGMHLTGGLEMSNGVELYNLLLHRYGHTHAQCLAELLRLLVQIHLLNPDPTTGKLETVRDYFDRAARISREAREFPQMKFPIAGPLLKVLILEGLNKSDRVKYSQMVITAYANDLVDDLDRLQTTMETVEGLRSQQIRDEFAPTQLATAQVNMGASASGDPHDPSNDPNGPCDAPGHIGHLNKQCRSKWGRQAEVYRGGGRGRGRGGRGRGRSRGRGNGRGGRDNSCHYYNSGRTCPYGATCKYDHDPNAAKAYITANTYTNADPATGKGAAVNVATATRTPYGYIMGVDSESGDTDTESGNE